MPPTGHVHRMEVITYATDPAYGPPGVLLGCTGGICAKTEWVSPTKRDRKVPEGLTRDQFGALQAGQFWPEILKRGGAAPAEAHNLGTAGSTPAPATLQL